MSAITPRRLAQVQRERKLAATTPGQKMNLGKAGEYADAESGLLDNGFRALDPWRGRYTQADLVGLDSGSNRFGYVEADPLGAIDPEGLQSARLPPSAATYSQPILNMQAANLIRDIRTYQPNYKHESVSQPGVGFSAANIAQLRSTLEMLQRAQSCVRFPSLDSTIARIQAGQPFPHRNDGTVFRNKERRLPRKPEGYYREWVHPTQGVPGQEHNGL